METAALVQIDGAIDAKTVVLFQEQLDQLQQNGYTRFILDMEGIKYVNSTGLGTLVNVADALETRGGGIALIKIHPKVKVVFDMLGLNAFFKIFSNEDEAIQYFHKGSKAATATSPAVGTSPLPSKPAAPPVISTPAPVPSTGTRQLSQVPTSAPVAQPLPPMATNVVKGTATAPVEPGGPYSLVCAICKVKLTIPKPGSFKCPRCATFFKLFNDASVTFSERKKASPLQMKLSCTDECMQGLCEFIGVLAGRIGFSPDDVHAIKESLAETCGAVIEKAYDNKQYLSYNVVINPSSTDLKIQISDYGKFIYEEQSRFHKTMQVMDEFEHKQHPKGGNIINLTKCVH